MANISEAAGYMELVGDWSPKDVEKLNRVAADVWPNGAYNIEGVRFEAGYRTSRFDAYGRWSFRNNLENLGDWTLNGENADKAEVEALFGAMKEKNLSVKVEYTDYEGGNRLLQECSGELTSDGTTLRYNEQSYVDLEFTWDNIPEPDDYLFDELVNETMLSLALPIDKKQAVEDWLWNNTAPYDTIEPESEKHNNLLIAIA